MKRWYYIKSRLLRPPVPGERQRRKQLRLQHEHTLIDRATLYNEATLTLHQRAAFANTRLGIPQLYNRQ